MEEELDRMQEGTALLERAVSPQEILELIKGVPPKSGSTENMTHALFAEEGGRGDQKYIVRRIPTKRVFRSKFSEFWFKKYVAPRILFKAYTAEVLLVIFKANDSASGGQRGCRYEDLFHKVLPLGMWDVKNVPLKEGPSWMSAISSVAAYFGGW